MADTVEAKIFGAENLKDFLPKLVDTLGLK